MTDATSAAQRPVGPGRCETEAVTGRAMSDLERAGGRGPSRVPLLWVVLLLGAGVLGMHALGTGHGGHGATDPAATTIEATGHHLGSYDPPPGDGHLNPMAAPVTPGAEAGHGCDGSCAAGVGTTCVAVLSGLVVLLLHRRPAGSLSVPVTVLRSSVLDRVVPGDWIPPARLLLCVSRT